jgi:hypothetical protein
MPLVAVRIADTMLLWLAALSLTSCAPISHSLISLDGSDTNDLSHASVLLDSTKRPLLLRGLDGKPLSKVRIPNVMQDYSYVLSAGKHVLWVSSIPYGQPLIPQYLRCYVIDVTFEHNTRYILEEHQDHEQAVVLHENTKQEIAVGRLVDKAPVFQRNCRWQ